MKERTNLEVAKAKMFPYELEEDTLEILLEDEGLDPSSTYSRNDKQAVIKAVINALYQLITLEKEKDNGSEMQYDTDKILDLIHHYEKEDPVDKKPVNRDMTHIW